MCSQSTNKRHVITFWWWILCCCPSCSHTIGPFQFFPFFSTDPATSDSLIRNMWSILDLSDSPTLHQSKKITILLLSNCISLISVLFTWFTLDPAPILSNLYHYNNYHNDCTDFPGFLNSSVNTSQKPSFHYPDQISPTHSGFSRVPQTPGSQLSLPSLKTMICSSIQDTDWKMHIPLNDVF